jgi:hypothetical protein
VLSIQGSFQIFLVGTYQRGTASTLSPPNFSAVFFSAQMAFTSIEMPFGGYIAGPSRLQFGCDCPETGFGEVGRIDTEKSACGQ